MASTSRRLGKLASFTWRLTLVVGVGLLAQAAPTGRADGCGDANPADTSAGGCINPVPPAKGDPPWLTTLERRAPHFADSDRGTRERFLQDWPIPAKY